MEYLTIDSQVMTTLDTCYMHIWMKIKVFKPTLQAFSTDNGRALEQIFGEHSEGSRDYDACLDTIAIRLGTVFASLKVVVFE